MREEFECKEGLNKGNKSFEKTIKLRADMGSISHLAQLLK